MKTATTLTTTGSTAPGETAMAASDGLTPLPVRQGPREETTHGVPHIQLDAEPVPEVDAELRRRAFSLPGVEERESNLSLPGAAPETLGEVDITMRLIVEAYNHVTGADLDPAS